MDTLCTRQLIECPLEAHRLPYSVCISLCMICVELHAACVCAVNCESSVAVGYGICQDVSQGSERVSEGFAKGSGQALGQWKV
jgi:hypothetical protein